MSKYTKKVLIAALIVLVIAAIAAITTKLISIAVLIVLLGGLIISWCHLARCRFCDSWWTENTEKYVPNDTDPLLDTVHVEQRCHRCGASEYVGDFPAETFWRGQNSPQGF